MTEKMRCQFCSLDFTSAYKIVPHIYFGHRKKIVRLSKEKGEIELICPSAGCGFNQTSKIVKGTPKDKLFENFSISLNFILEHIRNDHTSEAKIDICPYCEKNLENIIYWEHLEEHMNNTAAANASVPPGSSSTTTPEKIVESPNLSAVSPNPPSMSFPPAEPPPPVEPVLKPSPSKSQDSSQSETPPSKHVPASTPEALLSAAHVTEPPPMSSKHPAKLVTSPPSKEKCPDKVAHHDAKSPSSLEKAPSKPTPVTKSPPANIKLPAEVPLPESSMKSPPSTVKSPSYILKPPKPSSLPIDDAATEPFPPAATPSAKSPSPSKSSKLSSKSSHSEEISAAEPSLSTAKPSAKSPSPAKPSKRSSKSSPTIETSATKPSKRSSKSSPVESSATEKPSAKSPSQPPKHSSKSSPPEKISSSKPPKQSSPPEEISPTKPQKRSSKSSPPVEISATEPSFTAAKSSDKSPSPAKPPKRSSKPSPTVEICPTKPPKQSSKPSPTEEISPTKPQRRSSKSSHPEPSSSSAKPPTEAHSSKPKAKDSVKSPPLVPKPKPKESPKQSSKPSPTEEISPTKPHKRSSKSSHPEPSSSSAKPPTEAQSSKPKAKDSVKSPPLVPKPKPKESPLPTTEVPPSMETSASEPSRHIPVAVVNPVAAISSSSLTASPLPSSASGTSTGFNFSIEASPLTVTKDDDSSICTPPSTQFISSSVDKKKPTIQTGLTNIKRIPSSSEASADSSKHPVDDEQKQNKQDNSTISSIEIMSPTLEKPKPSKTSNGEEKKIEKSSVAPKQKEKIEDLREEPESEIQRSKSLASPREQQKSVECSSGTVTVESSFSQSPSFSLVVTPTPELESCSILETPENFPDLDSATNKEASLSPGADMDYTGTGSLERSSTNTPLQDEKMFSQSDVSMPQTPATPAALSPREKNVDKDDDDLEKEQVLEKLKALKEKVLPPPPKILPSKSVSRRRSSREDHTVVSKKPLLTEEMERKIIYEDVLKPKAKGFRQVKSEDQDRQEQLSVVKKQLEAAFLQEKKEKADKRKKEREEREKQQKREQAAIDKAEKRRRTLEREREQERELYKSSTASTEAKEAKKSRQSSRTKEKRRDSAEEGFKGDDRLEAKLKEHFVDLGYGDDSSSPSPPPSPRPRSSQKSTPPQQSSHSPPRNPPSPPPTQYPRSPPPTQYPVTPPPPKMPRRSHSPEGIRRLKTPPPPKIAPPSPPQPERMEADLVERGWREDRQIGGSEVEAWRGGKKLEIGGDSMALIRDTYGDDDVASPVKEIVKPLQKKIIPKGFDENGRPIEPPKKTILKGFDELGRPLNDPVELTPRPVPINPVLVKAANNAARGIMGPARAQAGGDVDPQLMCSLCKEDGQSAPYFSAYQLLSHIFLAHRKKIVSRSRKNRGMILACPDGCGFVTGRTSAGVSIEYYNGQLPVHLDQLSEHIRVQHTGEDRMVICQFCQFPLEHSEGWSWQHLANHRDSRRRYCSACNTFPFLNEVHKCTGEHKANPLPPPVTVTGDPMPLQTKAENKFGRNQRFNPMEGKRATANAKETSLERLARQLETGQLDASLLEGGKVRIEQIGKPNLIGDVERFDCEVCSSYWPKAGAWVSHMRQEHVGKGVLSRREQLACWCCSWTPLAWNEDVVAVGQLLEHVNDKHRGEEWQEKDWEEEMEKMEKMERDVLRQRDREREEAAIEIPNMPAECQECGDVLEDEEKFKRHYVGHKYGEVFCATCQTWILAHSFSEHMKGCNEEAKKKVKVIVRNSNNETWFDVKGEKIKVMFDFHESEEQGAAAVARCQVRGEQLSGVGVTIDEATKALQVEVKEHFTGMNEEESGEERELAKEEDREALLEMFRHLEDVDAGRGKNYVLEVEGKNVRVKTGWRLGEMGEHSILAACSIRGKEVRGEGTNMEKALKDLSEKVAQEWDKILKCEKCGSEFSKKVCFQMHRMVQCVG